MKRKISLLLSLALVMTSFFGGCGTSSSSSVAPSQSPSSNTNSAAPSPTATVDKPVTITFGFWGDTKEAEMKMELAKAYMEKNPNVTIEFEYTDGAGYMTKLQTWLSSNTVPDVFGIASDALFQFMGSDQFEDMAPYVERDGLAKEWNMDTVNAIYASNDKLYAVPFVSKVFAMAYNKDLFDAAGLPYPTNDWTVSDMLLAAEKLTTGQGTDKVHGLRWGVRPTEFYRNLYGNPVYNVDNKTMNATGNAQFKSAISLFSDTISKGYAPNETSAAISTGGFETGKFGMQLCATWDIATFQSMIGTSFNWDIVMLPNNTEMNSRMLSTYRGNGWSMSAASKEKEICWDFIKFMSANEESQKAAQSFGIPELLSYSTSPAYLTDFGGGSPYNKQVFIDMMSHTTNFYNLGVFAQVNDVIKTQYELLLAGKIDLDKMIAEVQKQGEALLATA